MIEDVAQRIKTQLGTYLNTEVTAVDTACETRGLTAITMPTVGADQIYLVPEADTMVGHQVLPAIEIRWDRTNQSRPLSGAVKDAEHSFQVAIIVGNQDATDLARILARLTRAAEITIEKYVAQNTQTPDVVWRVNVDSIEWFDRAIGGDGFVQGAILSMRATERVAAYVRP